VILDRKSHENDLKNFSFTFLELPKFDKSIDELSNTTEMWFYFFKQAAETSEKDLQKLAEHEYIIKAYEELNRFSWNEAELRSYDQEEKYEAAYRASLEQKFDEGKAEGRAEAKAEAKAEGKAEVAKNLLKEGLTVQDIQKVTGLSEEDITSLQ
jgi:predicted transposase/invertase (TIGR01784 family)